MKNILILGGGDIATGVALRLHRSGFKIVMTELPQPLSVRRLVSFSEAVYRGKTTVEGVTAIRAESLQEALALPQQDFISVVVDPNPVIREPDQCPILIDACLLKKPSAINIATTHLVIGLGPGFTCGENCHAVVETQRGHYLGRVYWKGSASADTGNPEGDYRRVLRSPTSGQILTHSFIAPQSR